MVINVMLIKKTCSLTSGNPLRFRKSHLERIYKPPMITDGKIRDKKLQYDINRGAIKISTLSSGKIDKYESLVAEEILPSN